MSKFIGAYQLGLNTVKMATQSYLLILCCLKISLQILLLLVLYIRLHIRDQSVHIRIVDLILRHLHRILYHLIHQLHPLLLRSVGPHVGIELLYTDFVLSVSHDFSHSVHDVGHLVHGLHGLEST